MAMQGHAKGPNFLSNLHNLSRTSTQAMVRVKNRYLLIKFLFPESTTSAASVTAQSSSSANKELPFFFNLHAPAPSTLTPQILNKLLREAVANLFGDYGAGAVSDSLQVKYLSPATATAIIRVGRNHYRMVWGAMTLLREIPDGKASRPCVIRVVRVSGTIRKAAEEAIRQSREEALKGRTLISSLDLLTEDGLVDDGESDDDSEMSD